MTDSQLAPFRYQFRTSYSETDQGGVIHHSAYPKYFEDARVAFLRRKGVPIQTLEKEERIGIAVVRMNITYKRPLYFDEELEIEVSVPRIGRASFVSRYEIVDGNDIRSVADITIAIINLDMMRAQAIPPSIRLALHSIHGRSEVEKS